MGKRPPPVECDNCGTPLPRSALACPECGADERTGWRDTEDKLYDGLDLPDSADGENPSAPPRPTGWINGIAWYWWMAALVALLSLGLATIGVH
jgi:hypothetical protein